MSDIKKKLGLKIKKLRKMRNLTQEQLAEKLDVSVTSISNIETGRFLVSFNTLEEIASILKVKMYELFMFAEEKETDVLYNKLSENIKNPKIKNDPDNIMIMYHVSESLIKD